MTRRCRVVIAALAGLWFVIAASSAQKKLPASAVDLNTATVEQLQQLPGIGPATAKAIVRFREKSGPFRRPEDLLAIHGISQSRLDKLRPYITVNGLVTQPQR